MRNEIDEGNHASGIFVDFQKAFDILDHHILLKKIEYDGVMEIPKKWFAFYLNDKKQFVSLNGYKASRAAVSCGVSQGSILGSPLFLIYINDLHLSI